MEHDNSTVPFKRNGFPVSSIRASLAIALIAIVAIILIPLQYLSVTFNLPSKRWIPVFFHRVNCLALGIHKTINGATHS